MAKFCSKCGRALTNENAAFCPGCGACLTPAANNNPAPVIPPVNSGVVQKAPAPVPPTKPVTP
ncbi:MAG: hypothetical protein MJ067_03365, partial [Oscillospiraceae bacterium]|nr:hypothetical protein [Oscillospiraceae bacterium]